MNEYMTGEVQLYSGSEAPRGWKFCNGEIVSIQQYTALFMILGIRYGGDGRRSFALPKLEPVQAGNGMTLNYIINLNGIFPQIV